MGSLSKRLERLEGGSGSFACEECAGLFVVRFLNVREVLKAHRVLATGEKEPIPHDVAWDLPERCEVCGRRQAFDIRLRGLDEKSRGAEPEGA